MLALWYDEGIKCTKEAFRVRFRRVVSVALVMLLFCAASVAFAVKDTVRLSMGYTIDQWMQRYNTFVRLNPTIGLSCIDLRAAEISLDDNGESWYKFSCSDSLQLMLCADSSTGNLLGIALGLSSTRSNSDIGDWTLLNSMIIATAFVSDEGLTVESAIDLADQVRPASSISSMTVGDSIRIVKGSYRYIFTQYKDDLFVYTAKLLVDSN